MLSQHPILCILIFAAFMIGLVVSVTASETERYEFYSHVIDELEKTKEDIEEA